MNKRVVVFDAMGVLYDHADDVADLLVPFVIEAGGTTDVNLINQAYLKRSLGELDHYTFWSQLGVIGDHIDDRYCQNHRLVPGVLAALRTLHDDGVPLGCLSNDVAEWSLTLRQRFGLDHYINTWVISGDQGNRKPDPEIYLKLMELMDVQPDEVILIDDRLANLSTAHALGMRTISFGEAQANSRHAAASHMKDLGAVLTGLLHYGESVSVRERELKDIDKCVSILRQVHAQHQYPLRWPDNARAFLSPGGLIASWVAEENFVVGHVSLMRVDPASPEVDIWSKHLGVEAKDLAAISRFFVDPQQDARGVGTTLLLVARDYALNIGMSPVIEVATNNVSAIALYKKMGWQLVGTTRPGWLSNGLEIELYAPT